MAMSCTVCGHPARAAIDHQLVNRDSLRDIARQHGLSKDALSRHKAEHLPAKLAQAQAAKETVQADDLLAQVKALRGKSISILQKAEAAGDLRTALLGIREARACIELLAEMEGEINRNPQINILVAPEWLAVRAVLLRALTPYPDARTAVAAALTGVERGDG